tara:strand:- start:68 stop:919 length:852 start_codon:yes stop_codon:yes gene_type:complete
MFKQVTIIGPGLLGASLILAVKKKQLAEKIVVWTRSTVGAENVSKNLPADKVEESLTYSVRGSDLVVVCTPVETITSILASIVGALKTDCIVTDVGSVKTDICRKAEDLFKKSGANFIGSHPMAGSEKSGMEHANENLFINRPCIVTPIDEDNSTSLKKISRFWEQLGMKSIFMNPEDHDKQLSDVSHLPHLISSILAHCLSDSAIDASSLCGQGLRDTVRIAGGSPELWAGILEQNQTNILASLGKFQKSLQVAQSLILENNFTGLIEFLEKGTCFQKSLNK